MRRHFAMKLSVVVLICGVVQGVRREVCYGELGCLVTDHTWFNAHRPLNPTPFQRSAINTSFVLHARDVPGAYVSTGDRSTLASLYKASRRSKFIIHGFTKNGSELWIVSLIAYLLSVGDFNVINVRWGPGAAEPYQQAVSNARVVGMEIAHLINTLVADFGARADDFHIIGFSLGAHVAGYAGERVANLGRITGLDPAGPFFQYTPPFVRLDPTDAQFVDAIHTNGMYTDIQVGKGLMQPVGHLDFYPNGGLSQPACGSRIPDFNSGCSHNRAHAIYSETLVSSCQPVAYECSSYAAFKRGKCGSCGADNLNCARVGLAAESYPVRSRSNVMLYFDTSSASPFCRYHYRVTIQLANPVEARPLVSGLLRITIYGSSGQISYQAATSRDLQLIHGRSFTFLATDATHVGVVQQIDVDWSFIIDLRNILTYCGVGCNSRLYVSSAQVSNLNNYPESARLANTVTLCPTGGSYAAIDSGSSNTLNSVC